MANAPAKQQQAPADPAAQPPAQPPGEGLEARVNGLETEQARQGGMLQQILDRLPGKAPAGGGGPAPAADPAPAAGKSVAEQVREGIAALEAERATAAEGEANKRAREDHAARIAALEERSPLETAATMPGALRAKAQRVIFGITESSR
jgi:hypothetical protein